MNDSRGMWASLSQLIFIVIFLHCAIWFAKLRFNKTCHFSGREATACISGVKPEKVDCRPSLSNLILLYVLIWWSGNGRTINFIRFNCSICITNTLIERQSERERLGTNQIPDTIVSAGCAPVGSLGRSQTTAKEFLSAVDVISTCCPLVAYRHLRKICDTWNKSLTNVIEKLAKWNFMQIRSRD